MLTSALHKKSSNITNIIIRNLYEYDDNTVLYAGSSQSSWSCYFFPETSLECRQRAFELIKSEDAWSKGTMTTKENYTTKHIWAGPTPR